jgi:hypothetical protein
VLNAFVVLLLLLLLQPSVLHWRLQSLGAQAPAGPCCDAAARAQRQALAGGAAALLLLLQWLLGLIWCLVCSCVEAQLVIDLIALVQASCWMCVRWLDSALIHVHSHLQCCCCCLFVAADPL